MMSPANLIILSIVFYQPVLYNPIGKYEELTMDLENEFSYGEFLWPRKSNSLN